MSENKNFFRASAEDFKKIPGSPVAYWASHALTAAFERGETFDQISAVKQGIIPGNIDCFVRMWYEVAQSRIGFDHKSCCDIVRLRFKWFPYNKGGAFRRWFGNYMHLLNMENDGDAIRNSGMNNNYRLREPELYFQEAVTWSKISSGAFSARYMPPGYLFDIAGCCIFSLKDRIWSGLGFLNSKVATTILGFVSPTLNYEVEHIKKLPLLIDGVTGRRIYEIVNTLYRCSKSDWDAFESSWDFAVNPLAAARNVSGASDESEFQLSTLYVAVRERWAKNCEEMRRLETENNRIFIEAYGLQDELTPEVPWHEITLTCNPWYRYRKTKKKKDGDNEEPSEDVDLTEVEKNLMVSAQFPLREDKEANLKTDTVKELISYAVGCMMGRYSVVEACHMQFYILIQKLEK